MSGASPGGAGADQHGLIMDDSQLLDVKAENNMVLSPSVTSDEKGESTTCDEYDRCLDCCEGRGDEAPVDEPGVRAWTDGPICDYCIDLHSIMGAEAVVPANAPFAPRGSPPWTLAWKSLLRAYFTLKLEGKVLLTVDMVWARQRILDAVLEKQGGGQASNIAARTSTSSGSLSSKTTLVFGLPPKNCHETLGKPVIPEESPRGVPPTQDTDMLTDTLVRTDFHMKDEEKTRQIGYQGGIAEVGSVAPGTDATELPGTGVKRWHICQGTARQDEDCLSVSGKFPKGTLGLSITRIRGTVNQYVTKMATPGWFHTYKRATVKSLERRLRNYAGEVEKSAHIDMITGQSGGEPQNETHFCC